MKPSQFFLKQAFFIALFSPLVVFSQSAHPMKVPVKNLLNETLKQGLVLKKYQSAEAQLDSLLSAGLLQEAQKQSTELITAIATDLVAGQVKAADLKKRFVVPKKSLQKHQIESISRYVAGNMSVEELVQILKPKNIYYSSLIQTLHKFQSLLDSGSMMSTPKTLATIKPGVKDQSSILYARFRLSLLGYGYDSKHPQLTEDLVANIIEFQKNHNLVADGVLGPASWKVLSQDLPALVTKLRLNIDRTRWLPDDLGADHVYVNLAEQKLRLFLNSQLSMDFKTVNGRLDRQTPILFDRMTYIMLNPTWTIPQSILLKDKVPIFSQNPQKVHDMRMKVIDDVNGNEVDPFTVNWARLSVNYNPYSVVQQPGKHNALGFIKFPLTNPYAIYLHDTDSRHLFEQPNRLQSSGCVRLEKPFEFAEKILNSTQWTADSLRQASEYLIPEATASTRIKLTRSIPVYLFYSTASVTDDGKIILSQDNYGLDQLTYQILIGR